MSLVRLSTQIHLCLLLDYLRKFTWDKKLETLGKSEVPSSLAEYQCSVDSTLQNSMSTSWSGTFTRTQPTILPPNEYSLFLCLTCTIIFISIFKFIWLCGNNCTQFHAIHKTKFASILPSNTSNQVPEEILQANTRVSGSCWYVHVCNSCVVDVNSWQIDDLLSSCRLFLTRCFLSSYFPVFPKCCQRVSTNDIILTNDAQSSA
jgi:hypothetical protein